MTITFEDTNSIEGTCTVVFDAGIPAQKTLILDALTFEIELWNNKIALNDDRRDIQTRDKIQFYFDRLTNDLEDGIYLKEATRKELKTWNTAINEFLSKAVLDPGEETTGITVRTALDTQLVSMYIRV